MEYQLCGLNSEKCANICLNPCIFIQEQKPVLKGEHKRLTRNCMFTTHICTVIHLLESSVDEGSGNSM